MLAVRKATFSCTSWSPNVPVPLLNAVLDGRLSKVDSSHVEPGIPGAKFIRVVENLAKSIVNDIAETDIDVLRPKFTKPWSESSDKANK